MTSDPRPVGDTSRSNDTAGPADAGSVVTRRRRLRHPSPRVVKWIAVVAGLLGTLLALVTPLLPVNQKTAELHWPQGQSVGAVSAPLVSFVPIDLDLAVPCRLADDLPGGSGVLLSSTPAAGQDATARGLFVRATPSRITVTDRDVVILSAPRSVLADPACTITLHGDGSGLRAAFRHARGPGQLSYSTSDQEMRPQILGVYTDLPPTAPRDGLSLHATIDTRYVNSPTTIKLVVIVVGVILALVSLVALGLLDRRDRHGHRRFLPSHWWTIRPPDVVVTVLLGLWWFLGPNTSDDGYVITVSRIAGGAGYADNYFRYFGVPQDPFGWHYWLFTAMGQISWAAPWLRLPTLLLGLLGWWLISREVIPRLGRAVRTSTPAVWAGVFGYLAIWMAYDTGLRVEPPIAIGSLLTWCCVERAIATRRLLPYAVAVIVAAFTLALAPSGLMAVAALVAGVRPVLKGLVGRRRRDGLIPMLAPILAAGTLVLFEIFAAQPLAPLIAGNKVASDVGPTLSWWAEPIRYYYLMLPTADGTLVRRFGVLVMFVCLAFLLLRLLRRSHPTGFARAPIWRLIAIVLGTMFLMAFSPTKWTHQFGVYAGIGGGLAAAAAAMAAPSVLRSRRNRAFFAAALIGVTGVAFAGPNGWWYVGSYGIPWWDRPPTIAGVHLYWPVLAVAIIAALMGLWCHFRDDYTDEATRTRGSDRWWSRFKVSPLPVITGAMVVFMVACFLKGAYVQRDSWSWAKSDARALTGNSCGLANDILVEADPSAGLLIPATVGGRPATDVGTAFAGTGETGFSPNRIPDRLTDDSSAQTMTSTSSVNTASTGAGADAQEQPGASAQGGTEGGRGRVGINGSAARLPFGLDPARTPVLGSFGSPGGTADLTSGWYRLPPRSPDRPLLTVAAAGSVRATDSLGAVRDGARLVIEYGRTEPDGRVVGMGTRTPVDALDPPTWRNLRFPLADAPPRATLARVVVHDDDPGPNNWVALTPPRVSPLVTLDHLVGHTDPVLIDWLVAFVFPCQQPMRVSHGVADVPRWRILPDAEATRKNSQTWMAGTAGGPLGLTEAMLTPTLLPSYLRNNWSRDWGGLQRFTEISPAPPARLDTGTARRSGQYDPAPMRSSGY